MKIVIADPRKRFGRIEIPPGNIAPTLLGTDYKSPHLLIEYEEDNVLQFGSTRNSEDYSRGLLQVRRKIPSDVGRNDDDQRD